MGGGATLSGLVVVFIAAEAEGCGFISPLSTRGWASRSPVRIPPTPERTCCGTWSVLCAALTARLLPALGVTQAPCHGLGWAERAFVSVFPFAAGGLRFPVCPVFLPVSSLPLLPLCLVPGRARSALCLTRPISPTQGSPVSGCPDPAVSVLVPHPHSPQH